MKYVHRDASECRYQLPGGVNACPENLHEVVSEETWAALQEAKTGMAEAFDALSPEALASVRLGLQQASEGRGEVRSFAQYVED